MQQIRTNHHPHSRFWLLLLVLLTLIVVRYALQVAIPREVFLLLIALICLLGDQNEIIAMCMCCIPLHESIDFFYALVLCAVIYAFKYSRYIRINVSVIFIFVMIIWELLHCLRSSFSIMGFITNIIPLGILAVMMCSDLSRLDYAFIVRAMSIAALGVCLSLFLKVLFLANFNIVLAVSGLQRLGLDTAETRHQITVTGGEVNPNTLGIIGVLSATGLMQLRTTKQGSMTDMVLTCIIMIFCALTASRTYLVCLTLMVVLLLFSQKGTISQKLKFICMIVLLIMLALAALYFIFPDLLMYYISRFFVRDITTGRTDLMTVYHNFIASNPDVLLFGIGLQDFGNRLTQSLMVAETVPHNSVQELVIAWGLPGILFFVILIMTMLVLSKDPYRQQSLINYIPLIIILVKGLAGQMLTSPYTMLAFSYSYLSLCTDLSPKDDQRIFTRAKGFGHNINQF